MGLGRVDGKHADQFVSVRCPDGCCGIALCCAALQLYLIASLLSFIAHVFDVHMLL